MHWREPIVGAIGDGWEIATNPPPNTGGVALIEAQQLAIASGLFDDGHWTKSGTALRKALDLTQLYVVDYLPATARANLYPDVDFSPTSRLQLDNAKKLWQHAASGKQMMQFERAPRHSDDVVVIDKDGNIAAITQSINCVLWGKTAIVVDGVTIGDPASFQQMQVARAGPGNRLESPTETGIVLKDGEPVLGFASMGSGLHFRTFQALANVIHFGMTVDEAIDTPDFFAPTQSGALGRTKATLPKGKFSQEVLDAMGYALRRDRSQGGPLRRRRNLDRHQSRPGNRRAASRVAQPQQQRRGRLLTIRGSTKAPPRLHPVARPRRSS